MNQSPAVYRHLLLALLCTLPLLGCRSQTAAVDPATLPDEPVTMNLWPGDPPGEATHDGELPETRTTDRGHLQFVHVPTLEVFHAKGENRTGAAVVICPGGGYGILAIGHEGTQVAEWLNDNGITAIILRYRHRPYRHPVPMHDVQRAMQTVRANADAWALDPQRVGVLGFSAGGHLASTATVHHVKADPDSDDPVQRVTSRPDFAVLVYPVISMRKGVTHGGSRNNLLGPEPDDKRVALLSNDEQIDKTTPPTLLVHSKDDRAVKIDNSERFLAALKKSGVESKLITFETGGHGYGLGRGNGHETDAWPAKCIEWFETIGVMKQPK
jgi:acetyl esterase/lipase